MSDPIAPGKPARRLAAALWAALGIGALSGSPAAAATGPLPATAGSGLAAASSPRTESSRSVTTPAGSALVRAIPVLRVPIERSPLEWEPPGPPAEDHSEYGDASWYGPGFHGRTAASGETYDATARTVAHRTLPLGTIVEIENIETGCTVVARVNDRGPYVDGRIVDCSYAVARELGFLGSGVVPVRLTVLDSIAPASEFESVAHSDIVLPWEDSAPTVPDVEVDFAAAPTDASATRSARELASMRQASVLPFPAIVHASHHVYGWIATHRPLLHVPAGLRVRMRGISLRSLARLFSF